MIRAKIRKILVPLDGSKTSFKGLNEAIYLARQCGATITGLNIVPIYPRNWHLMSPMRMKLIGESKKFMDRAEVISAQNGIVFHKKIGYGDAKSDINDYARENKFDLIVIGSRGLGSVKELFLGSVSNAVVHKSQIPVLVVK